MKLQELKVQLDTDAQQRCAAQEKTIKELHEQLVAKDNAIKALQNRCWALNGGVLCLWCGFKDDCKRGAK